GWLAVAATDARAAADALADPAAQTELWGLDHNAVARRLAHRWRFPDWLATALGAFNLPLATARAVVADAALFAVAQLAVVEAERREPGLHLSAGADRAALLTELNLDESALDELWAAAVVTPDEPAATAGALDPNPHNVPLLPNLLKLATESRRRNAAVLVARLEDRVDALHAAVARTASDADRGDRAAKLAALAELAAGAGHEINNPLAVISGNAQRLFRTEPDPARGESLQTIVRQAQRISGIVRDLMQFARPPRPTPARVSVADLLHAVRDELAPVAAERNVRLDLGAGAATAFARCDFAQIKHALAAVARNGIEAAGDAGWVRLSCADADEDHIELIVEDGGPGLSDAARAHCFDPFFCGRSAGRGRGLGLPTAWQFARQNGGDLRQTGDAPTRFALTVPRSVSLEFRDRQSA
ncbi:MAG: HAMP domain-containing histidine kinase, partial [Planctomycetes bacterium]|nr:HAMP domain-containing histidine kinase [Planctomycetota bacterium]